MSIKSPTTYWWEEPLGREEKMWITFVILWVCVPLFMMPYNHFMGNQNPSSQYTKITAANFDSATDKFIAKYKVGEEQGIAVVVPPPGSDIFIRAKQFSWEPILKLQKGKPYKLHLSSIDMNHGFSLQPLNINFAVVPGYDQVLNIIPTSTGIFTIMCNEYCGLGHHTMTGRIYVD